MPESTGFVPPPGVRRAVRRTVRRILASSALARRQALRLPFSRFHPLLQWFDGAEQTTWRSVRLEVNPGESEGYFVFFLGVSGACTNAELDLMSRLCQPPAAVLFDVGANVGAFSLAVAAACPDLTLVAFEPNQVAAARLQRNAGLNPRVASRLRLCEAAASDREGSAPFFAAAGDSELGSLLPKAGLTPSAVSTVRLDAWCERSGCYPDVLKIDVEGAELHVLEGMSGLHCDRLPRTILVEVHGGLCPDAPVALARGVRDWLTARGYALSVVTEGGVEPAGPPEGWPGRVHVLARRSG